MLLLGKIMLYIAGAAATIAILIPLLCMTHFIIRNNLYLLEAIMDEILDLGSRISQKFKRKPKK